MKVVVLGANGFIGKFICTELFINGYDLVPVSRADLNLSNFEEVREFLYKERPYAIINCTIPSGRDKIDNLNQKDVDEHLKIFLNFFNLSHLFERFINIGSGAEFDRAYHIRSAHESAIFTATPLDLYGHLKNTISRISLEHPKFYTLRVFGCFDKSESTGRFFSNLVNDNTVIIYDREMDFISLKDFTRIVFHVLNNEVIYKDINCVYPEKKTLGELASMFINYHNLPVSTTIQHWNSHAYSGNSGRLDVLNIPLDGLQSSLKNYFN